MKRSLRRQKGSKPEAAREAPPAPAPPASPAKPTPEYAALGSDAPIAWPSVGGRRVPVTGELSPHAKAALKRMGITQD